MTFNDVTCNGNGACVCGRTTMGATVCRGQGVRVNCETDDECAGVPGAGSYCVVIPTSGINAYGCEGFEASCVQRCPSPA